MSTRFERMAEKAEIALHCLPEETPIRGNAMASGDDEADREVEDDILRRLESGEEWAWCTVRVVATYEGFEGDDYLGCCSYTSEEDFRADAYFDDMVSEARSRLAEELERVAKVLED